MPESRLSTFRELWKPKIVKVGGAIVAALAGYDAASNQLGFVKIGEVLGMSGTLLPWWGWLLILQAIFVYALFEYVRRMTPPPEAGPTMEEVEAAILRHIGEGLFRDTVAETFQASDARWASQVKHFDEVTTRLSEGGAATEKLAKATEAGLAATLVVIRELRGELDDLAGEMRREAKQALTEQHQFQERMETWVGNLRREIRLGFKGVDRGFAAIYDRERLLDMAYDLTAVGDKLTGPSRGEPLGDWTEWQANAAEWHKAVEAWARLAEKWREGTIERVILATPPSEYKQDWGVEDYNIFPNHNAGHDYKTLCITSRNFHVERKSVDQYMLSAAFVRPSKKPVLSLADLKELEDENPTALLPPEVQDD